MKARTLTLLLTVIVLAGAGLLPVLVMLFESLTVNGRLSFAHYEGLLTFGRNWALLGQSLQLAALVTLLATLFGLPLGVLFSRTDLPLRRVFAALFAVPLLLPPYVLAFSWFILLGKGGLVARFISPEAAESASSWLFGLPGCVLTLATAFMPIVLLLTMIYAGTVNPHLEEAARLVGRWPEVLGRITIPLILPGVLLAMILVFLLGLGELGVPMFLRYEVFPVESFIQFSAFYRFEAATAASIPLAVITFLVLAVERRFLREKTYRVRLASEGTRTLSVKLGPFRWLLLGLVSLLCLSTVLTPLLGLLFHSASVSIYGEAVARGRDSLARSLLYALIGASSLSLLGSLSGYLIHTRALRFWRAVDTMTIFLFALPSTVIGIGLVSLWNHPSTNFIYGSSAIIILGYIAQYTALTSRISVSTLAMVPDSMEEAARIVGAGWGRRMLFILAPLARRGLIGGWLVGYIFCLRDAGISMMVYPPGSDTFTVRTFTLMANSPTEIMAALCAIMIAAALVPVGVIGWFLKRKR